VVIGNRAWKNFDCIRLLDPLAPLQQYQRFRRISGIEIVPAKKVSVFWPRSRQQPIQLQRKHSFGLVNRI